MDAVFSTMPRVSPCQPVSVARSSAFPLAILIGVAIGLGAGEAPTAACSSAYDPARPPRQFLVFDTVAVHTEDGPMLSVPGNGHKPTFTRAQRIPADWTAPVDCAGGSYRIRYEILGKPNTRRVHFCVVLSTPLGAKDKADLPSHPGSDWFTTAGVDSEEESIKKRLCRNLSRQERLELAQAVRTYLGRHLSHGLQPRWTRVGAPGGAGFPGCALLAQRSPSWRTL